MHLFIWDWHQPEVKHEKVCRKLLFSSQNNAHHLNTAALSCTICKDWQDTKKKYCLLYVETLLLWGSARVKLENMIIVFS